MRKFLGIDTSNYTTSLALASDGRIEKNLRKLLPVGEGERGLRQSDAVFAHTVNIPMLAREMGKNGITAIGVSEKPRDAEGSYMPCFLPGVAEAEALASIMGVPLYKFSHQRGHIMAALYSAGKEELYEKEFISFHVSGGTTELLHIKSGVIGRLGGTLDISAGKVIDRIGVALGEGFPCGKALEGLAEGYEFDGELKICVKGFDCNLSGLENKAMQMIEAGNEKGMISAYLFAFIGKTLEKMTENALERFPGLPVLFAGGVMSNKAIRNRLEKKFDSFFAEPEYSCDNAAGIALLAEKRWERENA